MALDNFRTIELIWDKANKSIIKTIKTASSDTTGRYFSVKVLDDGQEVDLTGAKLQLYWEHPNFNTTGTDDFTAVDSNGLFQLTFSDEMLANVGELNAHLVLTLSDGKITSDGFPIQVFKGADDGVVVPTNGSGLVKQIDGKIDKGNVTLNDLTQEVKLAMTGGSVAVVGDASVDTDALVDFAVTPPKIAESFWETLELQDILKSLENDFKQNNLLNFSPAGYQDSSSNATIGEDGEIIILANGHYFVTKSVGGDVKVGDTISVALKMTKDTTAVQLGLEFRNGEDSISITNLNYALNGWYVLEGVTVPANTTSIRLRVDNRQSSYASKFNYYTLQNGANLRATLLVDKQIEDLKNQLPSLSTYPIEVPYEYPFGFRWTENPLTYKLTTDGKGKFYTDFDVANFKVVGKSYYVDPINGSDTNLGSSISPFKSINVALNQPDIKELHLMEGIYSRNFSMSKATHTGDLSIIGHGDVHISSNSNSVLSKSASYSNVYEATRGAIHNYAVDTSVNNGGLPLVMVEVNSIEEVNDTKNSYYHDGTKLYIRTYDDRDITGLSLDHGLILSSGMDNTIFEGNMDLYIENVTIYGSTSPLQSRSTSSSDVLRVFGKDSNFLISRDENKDAVMLQGTTLSIFQNCKAGYSLKDGFNYHAKDGIVPKSIEINCQGFENGNDADDNDQGSTTHDGGSIIRIGGAYYRNKGANIAEDATGYTGTESLNLGVVGFEAKAPTETRAINFDCYDGVSMWLDGCSGYGSPYDISQKGEQSQLKVRNSNFATLEQLDGQRVVERY